MTTEDIRIRCPVQSTAQMSERCLLYTSDAADDLLCVVLGNGRVAPVPVYGEQEETCQVCKCIVYSWELGGSDRLESSSARCKCSFAALATHDQPTVAPLLSEKCSAPVLVDDNNG